MVATKAREVEIEAKPKDVGISKSRLENLTRTMRGHVDAGHIPGAATVVGRHGKVVYYDTYGSMDDAAGKALQPDTIFRIYSMTKPIASVALMTLYEENRFQLDDPASKFIPELKEIKVLSGGDAKSYQTRDAQREITIRDLLSHMAGFGARGPAPTTTTIGQIYTEAGVGGIPSNGTLAEQMRKIATVPLQCDPGTQWIYSLSTDVVARLCEVISGQPFDRFLRERIFEPLDMVDTAFYVTPDRLHRFAANYRPLASGGAGYELLDAPATSQFASNGTYFSGVGGLTSTIYDYTRFTRMLANRGELDGERIIGPRTLAFMASNHLPGGHDLNALNAAPFGPSTQPGTGFGLGFAVVLDPAAAQLLGSAGEYYWSGAASTHFFVSPRDDLFVVFMTQLMASPYDFRRELRVGAYQALTD